MWRYTLPCSGPPSPAPGTEVDTKQAQHSGLLTQYTTNISGPPKDLAQQRRRLEGFRSKIQLYPFLPMISPLEDLNILDSD